MVPPCPHSTGGAVRVSISASFDITEFPYWSMLFGDLHPHLMGLPFFGAVVAIGTGYVVTAARGGRLRAWLLAALLGLAVGLVRTVHTWDFPTVVLIAVVAIPLGQVLRAGRWQQRWWDAVAHLALAGLVAVVAFTPYTSHFETFDAGLVRAPETTKVHQFFVQYGVFIGLATAFLAVRYREELSARAFDAGRNPFLAVVNGRLELVSLGVFLTGLGAFTWIFGLTTIAFGAVYILAFLNLVWLELQRDGRDVARVLATALFILAFGVAVGVDVVTVKNDIVRMNTVFKFGLQAWQLFALASAYAAWYCAGQLASLVRAVRAGGRRADSVYLASLAGTAVVLVLLVGSTLFIGSGTRARQQARFGPTDPTLDGFAFFEHASYVEPKDEADPADNVEFRLDDDLPLIEWLRANVEGSPVIVEAVGPLYHWTGRISEYTGLPAVIGWDWHQIQQRTDYAGLVQERRFETERFFMDPSVEAARAYLRKYNVSYVVVGTEERVHGTPEGLAKFAAMEALTEVFRDGLNAIYQVDQPQLSPGLAAQPGPVP